MNNFLGMKLCKYRKKGNVSQRQLAEELNKRGIKVTNQAVSKWESGASLPNALQFLAICDILEITDISGIFLGRSSNYISGLNDEGRERVFEYATLLRNSGNYNDEDYLGPYGTNIRTLPVYNLDAVAGMGKLLDTTEYEQIAVGSEVPMSANFGIRFSGDSMEPDYHGGEIVWITQCKKLEHGEVGVFKYAGNCYFKRLRDRVGGKRLQCIDANYPDVIITNPEDLLILGKVAG